MTGNADLEQRVREAFSQLEPPEGLNARVMAAVAQERERQEGTAASATEPAAIRAQAGGGSQSVHPSQGVPAHGNAPAQSVAPSATAPATAPAAIRAQAGARAQLHATGARPAPRKRRRTVLAGLAAAACLALALVGVALYGTPTAFVTLDVNPSVLIDVNRFGVVCGARGLNADGEALVEAVPLAGKPYEQALEELTASAAFAPYDTPESYLDIAVVGENAVQADALEAQSNACAQRLRCGHTCWRATAEELAAAEAAGMGCGRYQAALTLMELDPGLTLEDCRGLTMRQLRDAIAERGGSWEGGGQGDGAGNGQGNGNGYGRGADSGNGAGQSAGQDQGQGNGNGYGRGAGAAQENGAETGDASETGESVRRDNGRGQGAGNGNGQGAGNSNGQGAGNGNGNGQGVGNGNGQGAGNGNGQGISNGQRYRGNRESELPAT